jgi:CubicO group peptidase (beta-lactamase class C family)
VDAGADQTIQLPTNSVQLEGSARDAENNTLTYTWSSSPVGVVFSDPNAAAAAATFPGEGTYTLTLAVSDGQSSGSDTLTVVVQPAPAAAYPAADLDESAPDHGWTRVSPTEAGMDQAKLLEAEAYALTAGGSGLIVRGGRAVHSWGDIDQRYDVKSTTKSIGGVALGIAIDEGRVALTEFAQTYLPSLGIDPSPPPENDLGLLAQITVLQLATHTAGFAKPGDYCALLYTPGTHWSYSDCGLNWLADMLTEVFAQDLRELLTTRMWSQLGVDSAGDFGDDVRWRDNDYRPGPSPDGIEHREFASGIYTNTNAMARFGLLFLRKGVWSSDRIVSESFVDAVQRPRPEVATTQNVDPTNFPDAPATYGVLWWTNASGQLPNVPRDAYWAWGLGESLIIVIPSLDLVIARAGPQSSTPTPGQRVFGDSDWNGDYAVLAPFLNPIVCAADSSSAACSQ